MLQVTMLGVTAIIAMAVPAVAWAEHAPILVDDTTGAVLFDCDFEAGTVGTAPQVNNPTVGTWNVDALGKAASVITDELNSGLTAIEGTKFLKIHRSPNYGFLLGQALESGANDKIKLQIAFRIPSTPNDAAASVWMMGGANRDQVLGIFSIYAGATPRFCISQNGTDQEIIATPVLDQWNTLVITHKNATDRWAVSLNGSAFETETGWTAGQTTTVTGLKFDAGTSDSVIYWDAAERVPVVRKVPPIDIGHCLELFIDDHLIAEMQGDVRQYVVRPEPKDVALTCDAVWEGNSCSGFSLFQDGDRYRMYYGGMDIDPVIFKGGRAGPDHPVYEEHVCYAESRDGIHFDRPALGVIEFQGSRQNNTVLSQAMGGTTGFLCFRDTNPSTPPEARYRAMGIESVSGISKYVSFQSPDGIQWKKGHVVGRFGEAPKPGELTEIAGDSENEAFWDTYRGEYRIYFRPKLSTTEELRGLRTATSKDFVNWENQSNLIYPKRTPKEHLYVARVQPYFRAPHLFIGLPTRFFDADSSVEPTLMSSRDGTHFHRWSDAVIPRDAPENRAGNRSNYTVWGLIQLPGKPNEISVYATEGFYETCKAVRVRRFAYRVDGFVALRGGKDGGEISTKLLAYKGHKLLMNYVVHEGGELKIEVLDSADEVIGRSRPLQGDAIDAVVEWDRKPPLDSGEIRLRIVMRDADVYSFQFAD